MSNKKNPRKRMVMGIIGVIFFVFIVVSIIIPTMNGSLHILTVLSGSMQPSIQPGDVVICTSIQPESIEINDIITFAHHDTSNKQSITHRVIDIIYEDQTVSFQTKGDANEDADVQLVSEKQVIGIVVFTIPLLGYFVSFMQSQLGFILLIMIPACILIVGEMRNIYSISKKKSDESEYKK